MAWPAVLAAGIAGTAGIGSSVMNLVSQADANKANREIAADNRLWQSRENRLAEQWQEKMWNATNAYNTPSAMKARAEEAGYNPYLFDGSKLTGSGSGSSMPGTPPKQGSPNQPTMQPLDYSGFSRVGSDVVNTYLNAQSVDANSANQRSQANLNNARAVASIYDSMGKDAAVKFANTLGYRMPEESPMMKRTALSLEGMDLQNSRQSLENRLTRLYGDKKAESEIANIEQLTTKYVGELGLMSARADLSRSEIQLNEKKAYALGAQMARDFAQARLFGSEAAINEGIVTFVVDSAKYNSQLANIQLNEARIGYGESYANYVGRTGVRDYKMSPDGQNRMLWSYQQSPEGNYVNAFIGGFTQNLNGVVGVNANISRSWSTSGSVNTSHSFIHTNQY